MILRTPLFLLLVLGLPSHIHANEIATKFQITKKPFRWISEFRKEDEQLTRHQHSIGYQKKLTSTLKLGAFYRVVMKYENPGWSTENRPYVEAEKTIKSSNKTLKIRNRLAKRFRKNQNSQARHRLRILVSPNTEKTHPFIAQEFFYNLTEGTQSQHQFAYGLKFPQKKTSLTAKRIQKKKADGWQDPEYRLTLKLNF